MSGKNILCDKENGAAIIKFNRPEKKNALSLELMDELRGVLEEVESDATVRAVVITGAGSAFSSGADLSDPRTLQMIEQQLDASSGKSTMIKLIELGKPTIAAVNGYALGHGLECALMCDIIIASDRAVFGFIGPLRGSVCPYAMIRLADEVGRAKAKELLFTCERISAEEALRIGLVNKVVPHEKLMDAVFELVEKMKSAAPLATKLTKRAINRGLGGYEDSLKAFREVAAGGDIVEGAVAFLEKRAPKWSG
jgi:enoyl-CoA hydratase